MKILLSALFTIAAVFGLVAIWTAPDLIVAAKAGWSCALFAVLGVIIGLAADLEGDI
jgi:hypothetical protein